MSFPVSYCDIHVQGRGRSLEIKTMHVVSGVTLSNLLNLSEL